MNRSLPSKDKHTHLRNKQHFEPYFELNFEQNFNSFPTCFKIYLSPKRIQNTKGYTSNIQKSATVQLRNPENYQFAASPALELEVDRNSRIKDPILDNKDLQRNCTDIRKQICLVLKDIWVGKSVSSARVLSLSLIQL